METYTAVTHLSKPVKIAYGSFQEQRAVIVRLITDSKLDGWGDVPGGTVTNYAGYDQNYLISNIRENFSKKVLGQDPSAYEVIRASFDFPISRSQEEREVNVKAALDIALMDLVGKINRQPVYSLLGGAYRDKFGCSATIDINSSSIAAEQAKNAVEQGATSLKVKVGIDLAEDVSRLESIRRAVKDDVCLWIDANEQWTVNRTVEALRKMSKARVEYVEQPVPGWDIQALSEVRRRLTPDVKVVADQSVYSIHDATKIIDSKAADVIALKPGRLGVQLSKQIAFLAKTKSIDCKLGFGGETGLGIAAGMHLCSTLSNYDERVSELSIDQRKGGFVTGLVRTGRHWILPRTSGLGVNVIKSMLTFATEDKV